MNRIVLTSGAASELHRIFACADKPLALLADFEQALIALTAGPAGPSVVLRTARRHRTRLRIQAWVGEPRPASGDHAFDSVPETVAFLRRQSERSFQ
ncbi:MAG: hypothetical protein ISP90_16075 [Nevskia sp.]|nr:hypothetical protein [Nevskia sp.]